MISNAIQIQNAVQHVHERFGIQEVRVGKDLMSGSDLYIRVQSGTRGVSAPLSVAEAEHLIECLERLIDGEAGSEGEPA